MATASSRADLQVAQEEIKGGQRTVYKMTVTPAPESVPALKYTLSLSEFSRKTGNAAPFYYRAMIAWPDTDIRKQHDEEFDKWNEPDLPLSQLPLDKVGPLIQSLEPRVMRDLREATSRSECDWSWQLQTLPGMEAISFLIPEMQTSRDLTRMLVLKARYNVAQHRYDDALDDLRISYRMARDVATEPLLICGLVGIAEASLSNRGSLELMAAKDSPNLYWALAGLPRPSVDLKVASRFELGWGFNMFPFIRDAESIEHSPQEWGRLIGDAFAKMPLFSDNPPNAGWNQLTGQLAATAAALVTYPDAKQRLINAGMEPARADAMPVGQVLAIDATREYRILADDIVKWMYVPFTAPDVKHSTLLSDGPRGLQALSRGFGYILGSTLLPSLERVRSAGVRFEWELNAIMVVEAIRMHAAATGKLPANLDEIKVVPVPLNPATSRPYVYRLEGDIAVIDLPESDGFEGRAARFEIKLAP